MWGDSHKGQVFGALGPVGVGFRDLRLVLLVLPLCSWGAPVRGQVAHPSEGWKTMLLAPLLPCQHAGEVSGPWGWAVWSLPCPCLPPSARKHPAQA